MYTTGHDQVFGSFELVAQSIYMQENCHVPIFEYQTISEGNQKLKKLSSKDCLKIEFDHKYSERFERKDTYFGNYSG